MRGPSGGAGAPGVAVTPLNVTSAGWQVTLCDPMWHVSSRSGVATLQTTIHLLLTYLLTHTARGLWKCRKIAKFRYTGPTGPDQTRFLRQSPLTLSGRVGSGRARVAEFSWMPTTLSNAVSTELEKVFLSNRRLTYGTIYHRNGWTNWAGFGVEASSDLSYTLRYKEIRVSLSPKIRLLPSGTLPQTPDLEKFVTIGRSSKLLTT